MDLQRGVREAYLWYIDAGWLRPSKPAAAGLPKESKG
jgi:hypothetical protein